MADLNFNNALTDKSVDNASTRDVKQKAQVAPLIPDGSNAPLADFVENTRDRLKSSIIPAMSVSTTRDVKDYVVNKMLTTDDPSIRPMLDAHGVGHFSHDPSTLPQTADEFRQFMEERGVPEKDWESLAHGAVSKGHLEWKIQNQDAKNEAGSLLSQNGTVGTLTGMAQSFTDPVTLAATMGAGAAVSGLAKVGIAATRGAQVAESALAAGTKANLAVETAGAGAGGVVLSGLESAAKGEDFNAHDASSTAAQFMALHLGLSSFKVLAAKREAESVKDNMQATGQPVNGTVADAVIHGEALPVDPAFAPDPNNPSPINVHQDPTKVAPKVVDDLHVPDVVENELVEHGKAAKAEAALSPKDITEAPPEVAPEGTPASAPVDVKPTEDFVPPEAAPEAAPKVTPDVAPEVAPKEAQAAEASPKMVDEPTMPERDPLEKSIGLVEPYKSPKKKLYDYTWGRTGFPALKLKFENTIDRDLFKVSFDTKPNDFEKVMSRLEKAKPEMTREEILDAAKRFRTEDLRRHVNDHPELDTFEIPTFHKNHMGPEDSKYTLGTAGRVGAGIVAGAALLGATSEAQAAGNGGGAGSVAGTAASLAVAAAGAVVSKGRGKGKIAVPHIPMPQAGLLKDLKIPFVSKRWGDLALGADHNDLVAVSQSDTGRFMAALLTTGVSAKKNRAVSPLGADIHAAEFTHAHMGQVHHAYSKGLDAWFKEKGYASFGKDYKSDKIQEFHDASYEYAKDPTLNASPALREYVDALTEERGKALEKVKQIAQYSAQQGTKFAPDSMIQALSEITNSNDYVRLMFDFKNIRMLNVENPEGLRTMLAEARIKAVPDLDPAKARQQTDMFIDTLLHLEAHGELIRVARTDPSGALEELISRGWASPDSAEDALAVISMLGNDKQLSITRQRFDMDRNHGGTYNGQDMKVSDLYVRDLTVGMKDYVDQLSGAHALTTAGAPYKMDLSSKATMDALVDQAVAEGATDNQIARLKEAYARIRGDEPQTNMMGETNQTLATALLGMSIMAGKWFPNAVLPEGVAVIAGSKMANAHRKAMPNMIDMLKVVTGKTPNDPLLRAITAFTGIGGEGVGSVMRDSIEHGVGDKASRFMRVTAAKTFMMNGLTGLNNMFKVWHARGLAQYLLDYTTGRQKISAIDVEKNLHHYGLDADFLNKLGPLLKKHAVIDQNGILKDMNFTKIHQENPYIAAQFEAAMRKHVQISASEPASMGSRSPLMASSLGKLMFQFVQPVVIATNRTRRDLGNFNADVAGRWAASFITAGLGYAARTQIQYYGDDKELEKRMKTSAVMKAAFRNSMFSGLGPLAADMATYSLGMEPTFADQTGRGFAALTPPALGIPQVLLGSARTLGRMATGREVTRGDVKNAMNPLQMGQWWTQPLVNALAGNFPTKRTKKPKPVEED